jgi:NADPH:quinone reductase-like Zn-dependent oxidoreductase
MMKAAVITSFEADPSYGDFPEPQPTAGEVVLDVLASGLHRLVRGRAAGRHYSSSTGLPQVAGVDGVGRLPDGTAVWFSGVRSPWGAMAEHASVPEIGCVPLPSGADPAQVAGQVNPALSSWMALTARAELAAGQSVAGQSVAGQSVAVLGATGSSGRQAIQIARLLGAGEVWALGRNPEALAELPDLGADHLVRLDAEGVPAALPDGEVDVVLDYLWGPPAQALLGALLARRPDPARALTWVQIGGMAGPNLSLPASALRSHNLRLVGSGIGSVPATTMLRELPRILAEIAAGRLAAPVRAVPLRDTAVAWSTAELPGERVVLVP